MNNLTKASGLLAPRPFLRSFFDTDSFFGNRFMDKLWDSAAPAVNIAEGDKEYTLDIVAPGFKKEDFKVDVADNILYISAEAKKESSEETKEYTKKEYNFSSFKHSFHLPENAKDDAISAEYINGILKVQIPKSGQSVVSTREINIK